MKFRKKPVEVEATQWYKNGDHPDDGETDAVEGKIVRYFRNPSWDGEVECSVCGIRFHEHGWIDTLEAGHRVCPGDWIITGIAGELYPCKPDIFKETYEPSTDS